MMKKYLSIILIFSGTIGLLWSCSEKTELVDPVAGTSGFAFVKIAHFSPNLRGVVNNRDSFNVYFNNIKLNGSFLTYGSLAPTITNLYAAVTPGVKSIKITVNGVNTPDSIILATYTKTLAADTYYSFIITDSLLNTSEAKQIFVQDKFLRTDTLHYTLRFVHAIMNDTTGKNVDIYSARIGANIFSNISPGTVSAFTTQPYNLVTDTFIVRRAGTSFELARLNGAVLARERAYTLIYKGTPIITGTKPRSLTTYVNQ